MLTRTAFALVCTLALAACGQRDAGTPAPAATAPPASAPAAGIPRQPAPEGARVYFVSPADGDVVESPVRVVFGLAGVGVAPAGIDHEGTGHHHLLINTELATMDLPIPADAQHVHFGNGQTEATIELPAGTHRLQLVLGDYLHIPHEPPIMSEVITVEVR
jgi:hypothetical protein